MGTKLQVALDDITLERACELLEKICGSVDIVEIGTPFLMEYGMEAVRKIKKSFPSMEILCDSKIMDAGGYEAKIAYAAGADYVTVLAVTDDLTIADVVKTARKEGKKVMADMICVTDLKARAERLEALGVDVIAVHTGVDQQAAGRTPLDDLIELRSCIKHTTLAVAGGIDSTTVNQYMKYQPEIVIVGSGIVHAKDPQSAVRELLRNIKGDAEGRKQI